MLIMVKEVMSAETALNMIKATIDKQADHLSHYSDSILGVIIGICRTHNRLNNE